MRRTKPVIVSRDSENAKIVVRCPCTRSEKVITKFDRPPLAEIQRESIPQRQYLKVESNQGRIKSTSTVQLLQVNGGEPRRRAISCGRLKENVIPQRDVQHQRPNKNKPSEGVHKKSSTQQSPLQSTSQQNRAYKADASVPAVLASFNFKSCNRLTVRPIKKFSGSIEDLLKKPPGNSNVIEKRCSSTSNISQVATYPSSDSASQSSTKSFPCALRSPITEDIMHDMCVHRCVTLPDQQFVTLSQNTLQSTMYSNLDSMVTKMQKVTFPRGFEKSVDDSQVTFVDGLENRRCSRLTPKVTLPLENSLSLSKPVKRRSSISEYARPAVKTTLKKQLDKKKAVLFPLLFSPEYIDDIISHTYEMRNKLILKSRWIKLLVDVNQRTKVVNWLLQIREHLNTHVDPFYMSVRLFDFSIIYHKLKKDWYQLAAIVSLWISLKFLESSCALRVPKIASLCGNKYTSKQIINMEICILKSVDFHICITEPMDFIYHYLRSANLESDEPLTAATKFVLDCSTLFEFYSIAEAPFIAASALDLAYRTLYNENEVYVNYKGYNRNNVRRYADSVLKLNVQSVIYKKFTPFQNAYIAKAFLNI